MADPRLHFCIKLFAQRPVLAQNIGRNIGMAPEAGCSVRIS